MFRTSDGGESWQTSNSGLPPGLSVAALVVDRLDPSTLYLGVDYWFDTPGGTFKSEDGGKSWHPATNGLPSMHQIQAMAVDPDRAGTVYAAVSETTEGGGALSAGVYKTEDRGATWRQTGLDTSYIIGLAVDPWDTHALYAWTFSFMMRNSAIVITDSGHRDHRVSGTVIKAISAS